MSPASFIDENEPALPIEEQPPKTIEERIEFLEQKTEFLLHAHMGVFGLLRALGEMKGVKLRNRQMPDGKVQFYWQEEGGRIVMPGGR